MKINFNLNENEFSSMAYLYNEPAMIIYLALLKDMIQTLFEKNRITAMEAEDFYFTVGNILKLFPKLVQENENLQKRISELNLKLIKQPQLF